MVSCKDLILCRICQTIQDYQMMNGARPKYLNISNKNLEKLRQTIEYEQENFPIEEFGFPNESIFGVTIVPVDGEMDLVEANDTLQVMK